MGFRFFVLNLLFVVLYGILGVNLYQLQVKQGDYYIRKVRARTEYQEQLALRRGQIFFTDRNGNYVPVALNKDYPIIYAVPKEIDNPEHIANIVSSIVGQSEDELVRIFDDSERLFALLVDKASTEQIDALASLEIDGIYVGKKQYRFYPVKNLASQLVGFVGINKQYNEPLGLYGIEKFYNNILADGKDIYLTIDRSLQVESEQTLHKLISSFNASGGTVIIQDPSSGEILALANYPDFDPNDYGSYPIRTFINPAVQYIYEAGSVFKPITMATGINTGALTPETTYIDKGSVTLNGKTITNWDGKAYGETTILKVIERSINTGAVFAVQQIGRKNFLEYLQKFGFGEKTGIDFPDEVRGDLNNLESGNARDIDFATAAFGQGTAITPLQLINAYSVLANGGLLMRPYIHSNEEPYVVRRVLKESTTEAVVGMMESAVEKAVVAAISGYRVAGKTGTAQIPDFEKGGYADEFIHTYVGFAPASNPRFVILIKLDKPRVSLAGQTVVPAFRDLAQFVLNYYSVPPDNLEKSQ